MHIRDVSYLQLHFNYRFLFFSITYYVMSLQSRTHLTITLNTLTPNYVKDFKQFVDIFTSISVPYLVHGCR